MNLKEVLRLTKPLVEILEPYNVDDAGKAIKAMKVYIDYQKKEIEKLQSVADALQSKVTYTSNQPVHWTNTGPVAGSHDSKYWLQFKESVKEAITEMQQ